jgi:hypothetical protein
MASLASSFGYGGNPYEEAKSRSQAFLGQGQGDFTSGFEPVNSASGGLANMPFANAALEAQGNQQIVNIAGSRMMQKQQREYDEANRLAAKKAAGSRGGLGGIFGAASGLASLIPGVGPAISTGLGAASKLFG